MLAVLQEISHMHYDGHGACKGMIAGNGLTCQYSTAIGAPWTWRRELRNKMREFATTTMLTLLS